MTYRILFIAMAAVAFAWGFSTLVEHRDRPMRSDNTQIACSGWPADNCVRTDIR